MRIDDDFLKCDDGRPGRAVFTSREPANLAERCEPLEFAISSIRRPAEGTPRRRGGHFPDARPREARRVTMSDANVAMVWGHLKTAVARNPALGVVLALLVPLAGAAAVFLAPFARPP